MAHPASSSAPAAAPQSSLGVPNFDWVHDDVRRHTSEYTTGASIDDLHLQLTELCSRRALPGWGDSLCSTD